MQRDYLTKKEFQRFEIRNDGRFDVLESDFVKFKTEIIEQFNRTAGMIQETVRLDFAKAIEIIRGDIAKSVR